MNNSVIDSIKINTEPDCIAEIEKFADVFFQRVSISQEMYGKVYLALIEAVENAMSHGNKLDEQKSISVDFEKNDEAIVITVSDDGLGFDYKNLPNPTHPDNLEKPDGRGVFIISNLSDKMEFNDVGNELKLTFNLN